MTFEATDGLPPIHPGEILKDELDALGLSARRFAEHIGSPANAVTGILNGTRGISAQMALRIGKAFGTGPRYWMALQATYEEKLARRQLGEKIDAIGDLTAGHRAA
jgi:addiction module HigA family antidote